MQVDLDALDRMVAEAEAAPILWASRAAFLWNAYPALAAELREARKRVRELEAEIEVRDNSANETLRILREALPNRGFHSEMEAAEAAAKEIKAAREKAEDFSHHVETLGTIAAIASTLMGKVGVDVWLDDQSRMTDYLCIKFEQFVDGGGLDARDRRMKALGAAEELRRLAAEDCDTVFPGDLPHITQEGLLERAAELEAAEEGEGNVS